MFRDECGGYFHRKKSYGSPINEQENRLYFHDVLHGSIDSAQTAERIRIVLCNTDYNILSKVPFSVLM